MELDGFAGLAVCAMEADGVMSQEEADELVDLLCEVGPCRALPPDEVAEAVQRAQRLGAKEGSAALLERSLASIPARLRPTAYLLAAQVLVADGDASPEEEVFLARLRQRLVVAEPLARRIEDVVQVLGRC